MSTRYGIFIVPQPEFTARAYRARQIICGQYGAWAAEMLMIHIMLGGFFPWAEDGIEALVLGLGNLASESRRHSSPITMDRSNVVVAPDLLGTIFLEFVHPQEQDPLTKLYRNVINLINGHPGPQPARQPTAGAFRPRLPLMQFADLPASVLSHAEEFAKGVVEDIGVPEVTSAWRLMLARFHSQAAGEGWEPGSWATDISWELLSSHAL